MRTCKIWRDDVGRTNRTERDENRQRVMRQAQNGVKQELQSDEDIQNIGEMMQAGQILKV